MFQLEMLPAAYGDCILITYGAESNPWRVLIDAGTNPTWKNSLREHLGPNAHLDLFVLTHIDADHVAGAIPFLQEGTDITIDDVWFNGWKHLPKNLLSAKQGEIFSTLIVQRDLRWNAAFDGKALAITDAPLPVKTLEGGMRLTLLSPTQKKLGLLARQWKKEIERHGLTPGSHRRFRQFLARHPTTSTNVPRLAAMKFRSDTSKPNGSSIALLAEYADDEVSVLLAGDAHAPVLTHSIGRLLAERGEARLRLDAFKVSHHGSRGNTNAKLLDQLDCPRYLISCNGDVHKLPDNETIGRIIHLGGSKPELIFNYHCERTKAWSDKVLKRRYGYSATYGDEGHYQIRLA